MIRFHNQYYFLRGIFMGYLLNINLKNPYTPILSCRNLTPTLSGLIFKNTLFIISKLKNKGVELWMKAK